MFSFYVVVVVFVFLLVFFFFGGGVLWGFFVVVFGVLIYIYIYPSLLHAYFSLRYNH